MLTLEVYNLKAIYLFILFIKQQAIIFDFDIVLQVLSAHFASNPLMFL